MYKKILGLQLARPKEVTEMKVQWTYHSIAAILFYLSAY